MMTMNKKSRRAVVAGALLALTTATPAFAATAPAPGTAGVQVAANTHRGIDGIVDHLHMGGSDTTYDVMTSLAAVYNGSVGCVMANGGPATYCSGAATVTSENHDHDVLSNEYPVGSGGGRAKLLGNLDLDLVAGNDTDPNFRIARSSGAPTESGLFGAAFAKDGIAVVGFFGNPTSPSTRVLSQNNLKAIFAGTGPQAQTNVPGTGTCATDWSQLIDPTTGVAFAAQPIKPFGIQSSSGTYSFFKSYLGGDDPDTCPGKTHGGGAAFFENNSAPIDGGTDTNGTVYATDASRANAIWWMSSAVAIADPASQGTATPYIIRRPLALADGSPFDGTVDLLPTTTAITNVKGTSGAYDLQRKLYIVLKNTDMNPAAVGYAGDSGPGGAAHAFRQWLCRRTGHATAPGVGYNLKIQAAIENNGMVRLSNAESSANPFIQAGDPAEKCANVSIP